MVAAFEQEKFDRRFRMQAGKIALLLYVRLGRNQRRCGGIVNTLRNRMRHTLAIGTYMMAPQIEQTCVHQVLKQFLVESQNVKRMIEKGRAFVEKIKVL